MKKLLILLPLLFLFSCEKKSETNDDCIDQSAINPDLHCYAVYDPVCGCDGITYGNDCEAGIHGVKHFTPGACGCEYPYSGLVVDYISVHGCEKVISMADGTLLEPVNLPKDFTLNTGSQVQFNYRPVTTYPSQCGGGAMADIFCIKQFSCLPLAKPSLNYVVMKDQVHINKAQVSGDCLTINYSYAGGCGKHEFELRLLDHFCATPPLPPTTLQFVHEANGDVCQAFITEERSYDLSSVQEPGKNSVQVNLIDYHGKYNTTLTYTY